MHKLYELKESLCKELENYAGKSISIASLKEIDLFAHAIKNICKIIEAKEMEEYSEGYARAAGGSYRGGSYQGGSYRGGSYAQGGSYRGSYDESMESRWEDPREQSYTMILTHADVAEEPDATAWDVIPARERSIRKLFPNSKSCSVCRPMNSTKRNTTH